ncbi:MAG: FixH family protein [Pseudomonadota bacterium]
MIPEHMIPKPKKSKIVYFFFAFFAVVLAVNIFYIYISKKTWRGVVTDDPYHKGLNYNDTLKEVAKQKVLGWSVKVDFRPGVTSQGTLMVTVQDKNLRYIEDAKIYATFKRPAQEGSDFVVPVPFEDGIYKAKINFPVVGQWDGEVAIRKGADTYQDVKRYIIQ